MKSRNEVLIAVGGRYSAVITVGEGYKEGIIMKGRTKESIAVGKRSNNLIKL